MSESYDIGDTLVFETTFVDTDGTAVDPGEVTLSILEPSGARTTIVYADAGEIANPEVGSYRYEMTATESGKHRWRWSATGTGAKAEEGYVWVSLNALGEAEDT